MKGQVSIEFLSLLVTALLASALLVTAVNERALEFSRASPYSEAQKIAQNTAYKFDYALTQRNNTTLELDFPPGLKEDYNITVMSGQVAVNFREGGASFPTRYSGGPIDLETHETYFIGYSEGEIDVHQ